MKLFSYFIGMLLSFIAIGTLAVYGFDQYEPMWGKFNSLQVITWVCFVASTIGGFAFAVTTRSISSNERALTSILLGVLSAAVMSAVNYSFFLIGLGKAHALFGVIATLMVGTGAAFFAKRMNA